jgi:stringent starvation protein B
MYPYRYFIASELSDLYFPLMTSVMTSTRPYLIRAVHEWIVDNGLTPYIVVDAQVQGTEVPSQYVKEGRIVLNLNPTAVQALVMGNEWISFRARFSGKVMGVHLPVRAVLAIYAKENGQGMSFSQEASEEDTSSPPPPPSPPPRPSGRPNLRVVK